MFLFPKLPLLLRKSQTEVLGHLSRRFQILDMCVCVSGWVVGAKTVELRMTDLHLFEVTAILHMMGFADRPRYDNRYLC